MQSFMSTVRTIVWKDLRIERRSWQTAGIMTMFAVVTVITFNFALGLNLESVRVVASGLLWITVLLAGTLGLTRSAALETENRPIDALLIAPIERSAIYIGKVISIFIFTSAMEVVLIPIFIAFTGRPFWRPQVLLILMLGTLGYLAAGVLIASMATQTQANHVLVPVLLLPLTLPLVLSAATGMHAYLADVPPPWEEIQLPFLLVAVYDLLMLVVGTYVYNFVVAE